MLQPIDRIEDDNELMLEYQLDNLSNQLAQLLAAYDYQYGTNRGHNTKLFPNMTAYNQKIKELGTDTVASFSGSDEF